ncbi:MAG TPA: hypothetical protein VIH61_02570, partial [Waddliaceae bacterium]
LFEGKGWVDEKSLKSLAVKKISSLKIGELEKINSIADEILIKKNQVPKGSKESKKNEKEKDYANEVRSLVTKAFDNKDKEVRSALNSLAKSDYDSIQNDESLKDLFEKYKGIIAKSTMEMGATRSHQNYTAIEDATVSISHPDFPGNKYLQQTVVNGFVEYLTEQITEGKLNLGEIQNLKKAIQDKTQVLQEFINGKSSPEDNKKLYEFFINEDKEDVNDSEYKFFTKEDEEVVKEKVKVVIKQNENALVILTNLEEEAKDKKNLEELKASPNKEKSFSAIGLSEIVKHSQLEMEFSNFIKELGKKIVQGDEKYFEHFKSLDVDKNVLLGYLELDSKGDYILDLSQIHEEKAPLFKKLFLEHLTFNKKDDILSNLKKPSQ